MICTDQLRTLYSGEDHDHSAFVGRIAHVRNIPARDPLPAGWLLDIELMPDEGQPYVERMIPVYAFSPALGTYCPRADELISGTLWVQATPGNCPPDFSKFSDVGLTDVPPRV